MMIAWIADLSENVRGALDGLVANKMRAILTMLGVVIGVAAVIALLAIGEGAQASITDQIASVGSNLLFLMPGAVQASGPGAGVQAASGSATTLIDDDAKAVADPGNVPSASVVAPEYSKNAQIIFGDANINASVRGVTAEYQEAYELAVASGRFIEPKDVDKRANVVVLGYKVAEDLFGGFDPVGQKIKVALPDGQGRVSLTVVGVLEEEGDSVMGSSDDRVYVPISTAQTKLFDARNPKGEIMVSQVNVVAASEEQAEAVQTEIEVLLRERHDISAGEDDDFTVVSQADMLSMASTIASIMTVFLGSIAGISLLVGGIGIMNIMLVSVTERTREVGLRKAVGARKADILMQFLLEAIVLSVLGGLVGILLGVGLAQVVDMTGLMNSLVTLDSVLLAVGFSAAVGLFFGIYPANQAAKLNPIEALRYE
jgi:putative ABC transport system permease protein